MKDENENEPVEKVEETETPKPADGKPTSPNVANESVRLKKLEAQSSFFEKKLQETKSELAKLQGNIELTRNVPAQNPEKAKQGKTLLDELNELWDTFTG